MEFLVGTHGRRQLPGIVFRPAVSHDHFSRLDRSRLFLYGLALLDSRLCRSLRLRRLVGRRSDLLRFFGRRRSRRRLSLIFLSLSIVAISSHWCVGRRLIFLGETNRTRANAHYYREQNEL